MENHNWKLASGRNEGKPQTRWIQFVPIFHFLDLHSRWFSVFYSTLDSTNQFYHFICFFFSNTDLPSYHSDGWEFLKEIDQMIPVRDSLNDLNLPACKSQLNYLGEQISPKSLSKN